MSERWPGDQVPREDGYGGVHGDCPVCGDKLMWTGWGWSLHSVEYHQATQRRLLRAIRRLLDREADLRVWGAQNAAQDLVGIRWRCGVYPLLQEQRTEVPRFIWEGIGEDWQQRYLADVRELLTVQLRLEHGVEVNPATWFHKVYDARGA